MSILGQHLGQSVGCILMPSSRHPLHGLQTSQKKSLSSGAKQMQSSALKFSLSHLKQSFSEHTDGSITLSTQLCGIISPPDSCLFTG